jgi:hypothetical protein
MNSEMDAGGKWGVLRHIHYPVIGWCNNPASLWCLKHTIRSFRTCRPSASSTLSRPCAATACGPNCKRCSSGWPWIRIPNCSSEMTACSSQARTRLLQERRARKAQARAMPPTQTAPSILSKAEDFSPRVERPATLAFPQRFSTPIAAGGIVQPRRRGSFIQ